MPQVPCAERRIEHRPEDLTCTVGCEVPFGDLQRTLANARQWLPLDPPHPDRLSVGDVVAGNLTGPQRLGFGTVRDYLIGLEILLADGTRIRSGGNVVKNVAGYDVHKLFVGSHRTLGTPTVANFRLLPWPETSRTLEARTDSARDGFRLAAAIHRGIPNLAALDVCRPEARDASCRVLVRCAGTEADVADRCGQAAELGFVPAEPERWDERLWPDPDASPARFVVLPSELTDAVEALNNRPFLARAGNGIVYHDGPPVRSRPTPPRFLLDRLKAAFDPQGILPPLPE